MALTRHSTHIQVKETEVPKPRYLTKSRFKLACECPTKLYYTGKSHYADCKVHDDFLAALAEGGFQVGELAKAYWPDGHHIETLDYEESLRLTNRLLAENDEVVIFEAAVRHENLFIRVDVLVKRGGHLDLIEVKAKSIDPREPEPFQGKKGGITADWAPYLEDVSYQEYVTRKAFPGFVVHPCLLLVDKSVRCSTDGLHQKFKIVSGGRDRKSVVMTAPLSQEELDHRLLVKMDVSALVQSIQGEMHGDDTYGDWLSYLSDRYLHDQKIAPVINPSCGSCEFKSSAQDAEGVRSGFLECWSHDLGISEDRVRCGTIFDVWDMRSAKALIREGKLLFSDLSEDDLKVKKGDGLGISRSARQWLQVQKSIAKDDTHWIDADGLLSEMSSWTYPLHMIDFETAAVSIPFHKGLKPYEGLAFQFSHHVIDKHGNVEHRGQYLNMDRGVFPNFDFIRALKRELENDEGTIFRYAMHENTYLNTIYTQLEEQGDLIPDREELQEFIKSIARPTDKAPYEWSPSREMVDLLELVKRFYYDPVMAGSNSIKVVLPAIMHSSSWLQNRYSRPVYGADGGIRSLNFSDWVWVKKDGERIVDPYKLLHPINSFSNLEEEELLNTGEFINGGGAAMVAYARMQYEEMSDAERTAIEEALLSYCELDTLAMVMLVEGWRDLLGVYRK